MRSFSLASLASITLATICIAAPGCAAPVDGAEEPTGSSSEAVRGVTGTGLVIDMAKSVASSILSKAVTNELFPAETIDYERIARDYATAARKANIDQTILEQGGLIDGKLATMHDIDVTRGAGESPQAIFDRINNTYLDDLNGILGILSQEGTRKAGLATYVTGAQVKLSMIAELGKLVPERFAVTDALYRDNAPKFLAYVAKTKAEVVADAAADRVAKIGGCVSTTPWSPWTPPTPQESFTDYETGQRFDYSSPSSACAGKRAAYIDQVRAATVAKVYQDLAWMGEVTRLWADALSTPNTITVTSATYGGSCGKPAGNVTAPVATRCDALTSCDYAVSVGVLGDPAYGCAKDFRVEYTCRGVAGTKAATAPAEADGRTVRLACP